MKPMSEAEVKEPEATFCPIYLKWSGPLEKELSEPLISPGVQSFIQEPMT